MARLRLSAADKLLLGKLTDHWDWGKNYVDSVFRDDPFALPNKDFALGRILIAHLGRKGMALARRMHKKRSALQNRLDLLHDQCVDVEERYLLELTTHYWDQLPYHERQGLASYFRREWLYKAVREDRVKYRLSKGEIREAGKLTSRHKKRRLANDFRHAR